MKEVVTEQLREIIEEYGVVICEEPKRLRALLNDLCPEYNRENFLLLTALTKNIVRGLLEIEESGEYQFKAAQLKRSLVNNCGIIAELASWTVDSWAYALGVVEQKTEKVENEIATANLSGAVEHRESTQTVNSFKKLCISTNTSLLNMALVPAGTTSVDNGNITLEQQLELAKYQVTNQEYLKFLNSKNIDENGNYKGKKLLNLTSPACQFAYNGSYFYLQSGEDSLDISNYPVIEISWYGAVAYCNWLSTQVGLSPAYDESTWEPLPENTIQTVEGYRLPTSQEWEYAARGGPQGRVTIYAGSNNLAEVAWCWSNSRAKGNSNLSRANYGRGTMPVGKKKANELGLYDMSGNVWEWCNTHVHRLDRVKRGGAWNINPSYCRVGNRALASPAESGYGLGFRLARSR
ncbi:formylglycine-generating enzyme family protein [Fuchsiella alkaliacetigena]|uniref:formylglycine-generating enzyme family protein n=1 Tax=Fuchsiella alkaliacetigena TaxID=957042 RepID=UPI002009F412|nr:SUMF1/EgtB/PvdO family nonheme iron enzyme [Fuchsiella alkaliacetigena]MCK8823581.1 formylglycine-generating enzyme family protein [Fuchsiella alkaliacetigena]